MAYNTMFVDYAPAGFTKPKYVEHGFGQVEPNHLSAQRTAQVYAQLPAAANIDILQQGQFVKYDYKEGEVNFTGAGEWMLVFNEIKLYRDEQKDYQFAMIKDNYQARVYSPFGGTPDGVDFFGQGGKQTRFYDGNTPGYTFAATYKVTEDATMQSGKTYYTDDQGTVFTGNAFVDGTTYYEVDKPAKTYAYDDVTAGVDIYEPNYNTDPFHIEARYKEQMMKTGTAMVPRVLKTNIGDIYTTNTIDVEGTGNNPLALGDKLVPRDKDGILVRENGTGDDAATSTMRWQVVKLYTMPDHQRGAKLMRIA